MRKCPYCGRENKSEAVNCFECGTELFEPPPPPRRPKTDRFWNRPLEARIERKAAEFVRDLPLRHCECGHYMQPVSVKVRSFLYLTAEYQGATYRCSHCGEECVISPGLISWTAVFGLLSLIPFTRPAQFTQVSGTLYAFVPLLSWAVCFRLWRNNKNFPEVKQPPANARFPAGEDGQTRSTTSPPPPAQ